MCNRHTGYGYIKIENGTEKIKKVEKFIEKPNFSKAKQYLESGDFYWNVGIYVFNANFMVQAFKKHLCKMHDLLMGSFDALNSSEEAQILEKPYSRAENISLDHGIMEKENQVYMVPASFG